MTSVRSRCCQTLLAHSPSSFPDLLRLGADCDVSAAVRGIEIRVRIVLMSGFFPVAVGGCFPISDVYFIMEDDIPWWLSFSCSRVCTV